MHSTALANTSLFSEISPWLKDEIQEAYFVEPFGWQK
jgi:hypothetical protein